MEFAVIKTGGKQYRVSEGDSIKIEKLSGEYKKGDKIIFDEVLLVDDGKDVKIGKPFIEGAKVSAIFDEDGKGKKISIIKFKSKSNYHKKQGHRQPFSKVTIESII